MKYLKDRSWSMSAEDPFQKLGSLRGGSPPGKRRIVLSRPKRIGAALVIVHTVHCSKDSETVMEHLAYRTHSLIAPS